MPAEQFRAWVKAQPLETAVRMDEEVGDGEKVPPAHAVQTRSAVSEAAAE